MALQSTTLSTAETDEDTNIEVCVNLTSIMGGLDRDVIVNLTTAIGTARTLFC